MRRAVTFLLPCVSGFALLSHAAPAIEWATHIAGTNFQHAGIVALSPAGNVYFTGHAGTGAVFGTNHSTTGWFLAKHNAAGRLLWIQTSTRVFSESLSIAFDPAENLYMTGIFTERAEFGSFVLNGVPLQNHIFLVKFEPDGHVPWAKVLPRTDSENHPHLVLGPSGHIYVAATRVIADEDDPAIDLHRFDAAGNPVWQQPSIIFSTEGVNLHDLKVDSLGHAYVSGNLESAAIDTAHYFLTKFGLTGEGLWMLTAHGTDEDDYKSELAIDGQGFIYIAGEFRTQTQWGTNVLDQPQGDGVFLAKVNPVGGVLWARNFHGTLNDFDQDAEGNSYLTGDFTGTLSLGTNSLTSRGSSDFFLARFDRHGTPLWVRQAGGTGWDHSPAVSLDHNGNVFLTGFFFSPVDFDSTRLTSRGLSDLFIAKYNRHGKFCWAQQFGGSDYEDPGTSNERADLDWAVDAAGNIYFGAVFWQTTIVGTNTFTSAGNTDVFFAKLAADPPETLRLLPPVLDRQSAPPRVRIEVTGAQGRAPVYIEASSDLANWTSIHTQTVPVGAMVLLQPVTNAPATFYRAVVP